MDVWIFKNTNILLMIKRKLFWFKGTFLEVTCLEGSHLGNKQQISNNILILINLRTFCNLIWSRNDSLIFELETKKYHSYYSSVTFHLISKCPIKHSWTLENLTTQAALKFSLYTVCTICHALSCINSIQFERTNHTDPVYFSLFVFSE